MVETKSTEAIAAGSRREGLPEMRATLIFDGLS
jgi:hypothetical protein